MLIIVCSSTCIPGIYHVLIACFGLIYMHSKIIYRCILFCCVIALKIILAKVACYRII